MAEKHPERQNDTADAMHQCLSTAKRNYHSMSVKDSKKARLVGSVQETWLYSPLQMAEKHPERQNDTADAMHQCLSTAKRNYHSMSVNDSKKARLVGSVQETWLYSPLQMAEKHPERQNDTADAMHQCLSTAKRNYHSMSVKDSKKARLVGSVQETWLYSPLQMAEKHPERQNDTADAMHQCLSTAKRNYHSMSVKDSKKARLVGSVQETWLYSPLQMAEKHPERQNDTADVMHQCLSTAKRNYHSMSVKDSKKARLVGSVQETLEVGANFVFFNCWTTTQLICIDQKYPSKKKGIANLQTNLTTR